jgi:hypothetical protein
MIWPSAVLLLPLLCALVYGHCGGGRPLALAPLLQFGAGMLLTIALLLASHPRVDASVADLAELTYSVARVEGLSLRGAVAALVETFGAYQRHVLVMILAMLSVAHLLWRGRILVPFASLLALAAVSFTSPYGNRILYLLPIHLVCLGTSLEVARSPRTRRVLLGIFVFLVAWNSLFSTVLRPLAAVRMLETRQPAILDEPFAAAVGPGSYRVYGPWEVYFPGLKLGWHTFCDLRRGTLEQGISQIGFDFAFVEGGDEPTLETFLQRGYREVPGWKSPSYHGKTFLLLKRG